MYKKLITACMAITAFAAFVLPAGALAVNEPQLTEGASLVAVGSTMVGTASEVRFTTTEGAIMVTCNAAKLTGTVKANASNNLQWEVPKGSAAFQGTGAVNADNGLPECTGSSGNFYTTLTTALCVISNTSMTTDEFTVTGGACGTNGKVGFIIGSTTAGSCTYESTGPVKGTYTTGGTEAKLTTIDTSAGSGFKLISGGFLCPTSLALAMTLTLETAGGTKLTIS